jgi:hypothetical protein
MISAGLACVQRWKRSERRYAQNVRSIWPSAEPFVRDTPPVRRCWAAGGSGWVGRGCALRSARNLNYQAGKSGAHAIRCSSAQSSRYC